MRHLIVSEKRLRFIGAALLLALFALHAWEYAALSRYLPPQTLLVDLDAPAIVEAAVVLGFLALFWWHPFPAPNSDGTLDHMRAFIEAAPLMMAMFDTEMRYLAASARWYSDYQLDPQSIIGKSHYEIFPDLPQRWRDVHQRCLKGATERKEEDLFVRENGTSQWVKWEVRPWRQAGSGAVAGLVIFAEDITARKEAELRERDASIKSEIERIRREDAERASITKDAFLAELSHEIRTPLQAILGWVRIVRLKPSDADILAKGLAAIEQSAHAQERLVTDIFDSHRLKLGKVRLRVKKFSLEGLLNASIAAATPFALERSINLESDCGCGDLSMSGDSARLEQCLWNLINNAIKFSHAGSTVMLAAETAGAWIELSVRDAGHGMTSEGIARAFEPLFQEGSGFSPQHAGLGLGLSIVRGLVELHGGSVRAESEGLGHGSTFTMRLPLRA